jgi:hypothetical protein
MARNFVRVSTQHLEYAGTVSGGMPLTLVARFKLDATGQRQVICAEGHSASAIVTLIQVEATDKLAIFAQGAGGFASQAGTTTLSSGVWYHVAGVFVDGAIVLYLNGAVEITDGSTVGAAGMDRMNVGTRVYSGAAADYLDGDVAEVATYSGGLTIADAAQLATGACPPLVRPESLIAYWPLTGRASPEPDIVGDFPLTLNAAPVYADHPRVYQAAGPLTLGVPGGAVASPVPRLMASYRRRRAG